MLCSCRIVPAMQMVSQVVLVEEFSIEFEESLARNAFLRDSRSTKPYVFP